MNPTGFLRLADQVDRIFKSEASWEAKYDLIFGLVNQVRATGVELQYYDPDTTYEEDVTAYARAVAERAEDYRKALNVPDAHAELIKLRTGIARLAMRSGLAEFVPGQPGREAPFEQLVLCAEIHPRGWNALIARMLDSVER